MRNYLTLNTIILYTMQQYKFPLVEFAPSLVEGIRRFSALNLERSQTLFGLGEIEDTYFTTALAEEVGEICGIVKRVKRGFNERELLKVRKQFKLENPQLTEAEIPGADFFRENWYKDKNQKLAQELADVFIYLSLMAERHSIDLMEAVETKFNLVTIEMTPPKHG